tara:strand:+ start:30581 stop:31213 length:633 start_codon:yes stop_codon:yes gene_type:complete
VDYSNFIKGKRVIFVGPAVTLIGKKKGLFIDSHDIVIRTNGAFPVIKELQKDYGKRCDSLYVNQHFAIHGDMSIKDYRINGLKYLSLKYDYRKLYMRYRNPNLKIRLIHKEFFKYKKRIKAAPLMGTYIIDEIINMNPESFYITGMSMYSETDFNNHHIKNYIPETSDPGELNKGRLKFHKQFLQNEIIKNHILSGKVQADEYISNILGI